MRKIISSKKAISEIISYVLLITIGVALSVLVFNWLEGFTDPGFKEECPADVKLIIKNYECFLRNGKSVLDISIQNKGNFNVSGFSLKGSTRESAEIATIILNDTGVPLAPGESFTFEQIEKDISGISFGELTLIEVQPFLGDISPAQNRIYCDEVASQTIICS